MINAPLTFALIELGSIFFVVFFFSPLPTAVLKDMGRLMY